MSPSPLLPLVLSLLRWSLSTAQNQIPLLKDRRVSCNSNSMDVDFEFNTPFSGVVYPDNQWKEECKWLGARSRQMVVTIPLNTDPSGRNGQPYCGVQLDETRGEFRVMLKLSPASNLLVDGMMALDVRCLYNINDVTLTLPVGPNGAGIFISEDALRPQTQAGVVTGNGGTPFLQMAIREGHGIVADVLQSASVGQRITLDVVMQDTTIYDFYVHDCYAHDGTNAQDASISIIDLNGCAVQLNRAVDAPVFETPLGNEGPKHVYIHMYGFQFTTSQFVYFECQVRPCLRTCNRPTNCLGGPRVKRLASPRSRRQSEFGLQDIRGATDNYNLTTVIRIKPQRLTDVVPAAQLATADLQEAGVSSIGRRKSDSELCVNVSVAIAILVIFVLVCVVSLVIAVFVCQRAQKEGRSSSKLYTPASTPTSSVHRASRFSASSSITPRLRH